MKISNSISAILIIVSATLVFYAWPLAILGFKCSNSNIYVFIKDWQTLMTGGLAILAAYIASKPVWKQFDISKIQTAAVTRDVLIKMLDEIKNEQDEIINELNKITTEFLGAIDPYDVYEEEYDLNHHWADAARGVLAKTLSFFKWQYKNQFYRPNSSIVMKEIIDNSQLLLDCFNSILKPTDYFRYYEDEDLNEHQKLTINTESKLAEKNLKRRINSVSKIKWSLIDAFEEDLKLLRTRISQIDKTIITNN